MDQTITVYGADWCHDTAKTQQQLSALKVGYIYINVDRNPMGSEEVKELNDGNVKLPTVVIEGRGTRILRTPSMEELRHALLETKGENRPTLH